jgi:isocitrate dehydrogenase kinase/phosphatase
MPSPVDLADGASRRLRFSGARREAWLRLFPAGHPPAMDALSAEARVDAQAAAELILTAHRAYLSAFNALTSQAQQSFETRAWTQGALDAGRRVQLYRDAVHATWSKIQRAYPERVSRREFWMGARHAFLERVFDDYDADVALTFFYSMMRIAFDAQDAPVEYADDGLAERSHVRSPQPVLHSYAAGPRQLSESILEILRSCAFRAPFEDAERDAALVAVRLLDDWRREFGLRVPRDLQMLTPVFYRDREAYLAGKLRAPHAELPVVLALGHEAPGIAVDAVLTGKEDMRNILFVSTRSTFMVHTSAYREVLAFLDTLAPERGHPAMCAVLGFTHPARVALNQRLRRHLRETGERFIPAPGRPGMAMIVFSLPSFPYVYKVVRDFSSKQGWMGRAHIMELYRWVHEMNRGRLMLDAWLYRNLHFPRQSFDGAVLEELLRSAPGSVKLDGETVVLKHVYAQRRVQPLSTFFAETADRALRERAIDGLGTFIKELAGMGFFIGDCYGLPSNTGLTHAFNVALFDFDDLAPILRYRFRVTPPLADERDEMLWNTETDGAWFRVEENDVLVDEWERFLGVPLDLQDYFRRKHGDLFTLEPWAEVQRRIMAGKLHFVLPYPPERRLLKAGTPSR